jgi:hydroxymethylpyrimidine pyrophosphatase-like HAD family hydrolase
VRVLYTDIDGTLVGPNGNLFWDDNGEWTTDASDALVAAHRAGLEIVALSGRRANTLRELGRLLGLPAWFGELGGVRVYERGAEVILDEGQYQGDTPLPAVLRTVMEELLALNPGRLAEHTPWNDGRLVSVIFRGTLDIATTDAWLRDTGRPWAQVVDNGVIPRAFDDLPGVDDVRVYHLTVRGLSKRAAIVADQKYRGIDPADCAVIGDAHTDLDCAPAVATAFVVRNAIEKDDSLAQAVATVPNAVVTERGHGGGFAEAVQTLLTLSR